MGSVGPVNLLLDTHIWLWAAVEPERLKPDVREALASSDNRLWLSPISVWEALLLFERGKLTPKNEDPDEWLEKAIARSGVREAPLTHEIALMSRKVRLAHQDPADRFLAATAIVLGLTLVTSDERLIGCADVSVLRNR